MHVHQRVGPLRQRRLLDARRPAPIAQAHQGNSGRPRKSYYDVLGVPRTATEQEVKSAFRRKAKETHPDVNTEDDAEAMFLEVSEAYEVLSDPHRRAEYDRVHGFRRVGFFQDVEEDEYGDRPSPFRRYNWARPDDDDDDTEDVYGDRDSEQEGPGRRRAGHGWDSFGGGRGERARSTRETSGGERGDGEGESESVPQDEEFQEAMREAKRLETLFDLMGRMGPDGPLRRWQRGETDPWGTSTSDLFAERVRQQSTDPWGNRGRGGAFEGDRLRHAEWMPPGRGARPGDGSDDPMRRPPGWYPPGYRDGEDEDKGSGRGGGGRRGWGDDGGFRGKPL